MTLPVRTAAPLLRRMTIPAVTLLAALLAGLPQAALAQPIVRLTRADGATLANGQSIRIGSARSGDGGDAVAIESPNRICCPANPGSANVRCVTERQVSLGASRQQIIDRYGPPGTGSSEGALRYVGIEFSLVGGQVNRICVVR